MKSRLVLLVLAILMAGSFTTAAVALVKSDDGDGKKNDKASHGKAHGRDKDRDGHGPPPWAGGPERDGKHRGKPDKAWLEQWKSLTPTERADKMAELAQEHADGMEKWAACVKEAGDDREARRACERPLPPGRAKKLLR